MILLYKKGDSHVIDGVCCDLKRCKPSEMDHYLSQGYVKSPKDLEEKKIETPAADPVVSKPVEAEETIEEVLILEETECE